MNTGLGVESIFGAALEITCLDERAAYLDRACGGDAALRARVEELLEAHFRAGNFLQADATAVFAVVEMAKPVESPGRRIGPYKLLQQIGEGGMGAVWMAEQQEPVRRKVALKIVNPGMDSAQVIARFEAERQALALMDHPNIAKVFDAGTVEGQPGLSAPGAGRPFFVMELVHGVPITQFCDDNRLTPRERLELFIPVCQAIQHAHQKGVIHRDVKPSNVLVTLHDGKPVPKVIDFGIAKAIDQRLTERTVFTQFGAIIGTFEYMSPEQAEMSGLGVDTRSDVYSLGVLLYELLTGNTPLQHQRLREKSLTEVLRLIREEEPPKPSTRLSNADTLPAIAAARRTEPAKLAKLLRGGLDWVVMKALEKDRTRRYETASSFARDVERYLRDEPVEAGPPSAIYKAHKFARRHKAALLTTAVVALVALLAVGGVAGSVGWAMRDRDVRRARAAVEFRDAVDDATALHAQEKYAESRVAVRRAEAVRDQEDRDPQQEVRLERVQAALTFVDRTEQVRLDMATVQDLSFDHSNADAGYRAAFREYGLDVETLDPEEAARLLQESPIKKQLLAALDGWVLLKVHQELPGVERLRKVSSLANPDPWRVRMARALLDFSKDRDRKPLEKLIEDPHFTALPLEAVLHLAFALQILREFPLAVQALKQALPRNAGDFWLNFDLGTNLLRAGQPAEAVGFFRVALSRRQDNPGVRMTVANTLEMLGRTPEALAEYREALRRHPDYAPAHYNLGCVLGNHGKPEAAEPEFRAAIRYRPDYPDAHTNLCSVLWQQGRVDEALKEVQADGRCRWPDYPAAHFNLGQVLLRQGQLARAEAEAREAIFLFRRGPYVEARQAHVLAQGVAAQAAAPAGAPLGSLMVRLGALAVAEPDALGREPERFPVYREAGRPHALLASCYILLGDALRRQKRFPEAEAASRKALRLHPNHAETYWVLGDVLMNQKRFPEAEAAFREFVRWQPDSARGYRGLGHALDARGQSAAAEAAYRECLRREPKDAKTRTNLGNVLMEQGKVKEALVELQEAVRLEPGLSAAHNNLGHALYRQGKLAEAAAEFRKAIDLKPEAVEDLAGANRNLGKILLDQGKWNEAVRQFEVVLRLDPQSAEAHYGIATAQHGQGKGVEAEALLRKAIAIRGNYPAASCAFGLLLVEQGRLTEAEMECRKAVGLQPNLPAARVNLGMALHKQGRLAEAMAEYRQAIRLKPDLAAAHNNLGKALLEQRNLSSTGGDAPGGGIVNRGTMTIAYSTVAGNNSTWAGGIDNVGTMTLTSSTVSGNTSGSDAGGILNEYSGALTISDSTIANSTAESGGGAGG